MFDKIQGEKENLWALSDKDIVKFQLTLQKSVKEILELIVFKVKDNKKEK